MLVLTRQLEQEILIGENISIKVLSVSGGQVRLGIQAPPEVTILREEVYAEVCRENQQAAQVSPVSLLELLHKPQPEDV
jgi:carbon storage regulator